MHAQPIRENGDGAHKRPITPAGHHEQPALLQRCQRRIHNGLGTHPPGGRSDPRPVKLYRVVQFRVGKPGAQRLDLHRRPDVPQLEVERLGENGDPALAGRVGRGAAAPHEGCDGGHFDERSAAARHQVIERRIGKSRNRQHMQPLHSLGELRIGPPEESPGADTRIVHQQHQIGQRGNALGDGFQITRLGEIVRQHRDRRAVRCGELGGQRCQPVAAARDEQQIVAGRQLVREDRADAAGSPGDDRDRPCQRCAPKDRLMSGTSSAS